MHAVLVEPLYSSGAGRDASRDLGRFTDDQPPAICPSGDRQQVAGTLHWSGGRSLKQAVSQSFCRRASITVCRTPPRLPSAASVLSTCMPSVSRLFTNCSASSTGQSTDAKNEADEFVVHRLPDPSWRRCPGRPRNRWLDQLRRDNSTPPADLWRRAVMRAGHSA